MKKFLLLICAAFFITACATVSNKTENPRAVGFNFQTEDGTAVLTFWKKLNSDGTSSSPFSIGISKTKLAMNMSFPKAYTYTEKLDPGYYYLDSFQIPLANGKYFVSDVSHFFNRSGWDKNLNRPYFMAFSVDANKDIDLPVVTIIPGDDSYTAYIKVSDPESVFEIGSKILKK